MSATQWKQEFSDSDFADGYYKSWLETPIRRSSVAALVESAVRLAIAESSLPKHRQCSWCQGDLDSRTSDARLPNVFCSVGCERDFVCKALSGVSAEDAIRVQKRLDALMNVARQPEV